MTPILRNCCLAMAWLAVVVGLPIVGHWSRQSRKPRCAFDGQPIERVYRVQILDGEANPKEFCCIRCAEHWLQASRNSPGQISVTDEVTGKQIDETEALFVRSVVVTNPVTGNRIHVFARIEDAREHAQSAPGTILTGGKRPFSQYPSSPNQEMKDGKR